MLELLLFLSTAFVQNEPILTSWILAPAKPANAALARVLPEVHQVVAGSNSVEVRSAGISLYSFDVLQSPVRPVNDLRSVKVRLPRFPLPETGSKMSTPDDLLGVFINGVPIPNQLASSSFEGRNLWHFDPVAASLRENHSPMAPLLANLLTDETRPSPIIGFALDGYPIYGPFDANRNRMRSGYRLRNIHHRTSWPDGTVLTPGQYGPPLSAEYPLGTFREDYEFQPGLGDLDQSNGRFVRTAEYPQGTYAYFVSSDQRGRLAFPYLVSNRFHGKLSTSDERMPVSLAVERAHLSLHAPALIAGEPVSLAFTIADARGQPVRDLEFVHEKPIHLIVVSEDLAEFDHIHPERSTGDDFRVEHTFRHGGRYRLYADFTAPGSPQHVEAIDVEVAGSKRERQPLTSSRDARATLIAPGSPRSGTDEEFRIRLSDTTGQEPYLGAWGHFVLIDQKQTTFIHAHPIETTSGAAPAIHSHGATPGLGQPPQEIRFQAAFSHAGAYKLWAQFQFDGKVQVFQFVLHVGPPRAIAERNVEIPEGAIRLAVGPNGFTPSRIEIASGQVAKLAITRDGQSNCASAIVFPELGIQRDLTLGQTIVIDIPAQPGGEFRFACGMGMYRGMLVAIPSSDKL